MEVGVSGSCARPTSRAGVCPFVNVSSLSVQANPGVVDVCVGGVSPSESWSVLSECAFVTTGPLFGVGVKTDVSESWPCLRVVLRSCECELLVCMCVLLT